MVGLNGGGGRSWMMLRGSPGLADGVVSAVDVGSSPGGVAGGARTVASEGVGPGVALGTGFDARALGAAADAEHAGAGAQGGDRPPHPATVSAKTNGPYRAPGAHFIPSRR